MDDDVDFVRDLFHTSYRRLVGQLTAVTGSHAEAEDAVQEAFVRAVDRSRAVRRTDNPEAWLRTVAVNVARSRFRGDRRLVPLPKADAEGVADLSPDHVALMAGLNRLPAAQREAIALHHVADLPVHEVAALLRVPTGTVKARLSRGRAALAGLVSEHADDSHDEEVPRGRA